MPTAQILDQHVVHLGYVVQLTARLVVTFTDAELATYLSCTASFEIRDKLTGAVLATIPLTVPKPTSGHKQTVDVAHTFDLQCAASIVLKNMTGGSVSVATK